MPSMSVMGSRVGKFMDTNSNNSFAKSEQHLESVISAGLEYRGKSRAEEHEISCIFKVFDDIRQDCLALQIIRLFLEIFERHNLGLNLFPYHTLSNRTGPSLDIGGII
uniref:Predicted protein n=1 Tax=Hordeum vulgare subsp. vulgare TaxID=112509 RepID=F2DKJ8_HORVV|nr:predicted protein [Hordeum vulgare subsp. vulgare]